MKKLITAAAGLALVATPLVATTATAGQAPAAGSTAQAATREAPAAFSVFAKINKATAIAKEDTVKVRGRVGPGAAGDKVVLQQRMEGKKIWSVSGTTKVKANGTFLLKDDPSTAGTRLYRVLKPAEGKVEKGVSKELELVVYGWEALAYRTPGPSTGISPTRATIATEGFAASLVTSVAGTPGSIEYTLGKKCLRLRSTYALTDSSATGGTGAVALKVDGAVAFASALAIGQVIEDSEVDVTDAFRISYELSSSATPTALAAIATPEVLCTK